MTLTMVFRAVLCVLFPWLALMAGRAALELVVGPGVRRQVVTGVQDMMRQKTEHMVKRWMEQRWAIDSIIQAVGVEWDQPRLIYTMYPAGPDAVADFRTVGMRVKKFADMHREFAAAARRREIKAENFESSKTTNCRSTTTPAW
jgi:hypothetical protein